MVLQLIKKEGTFPSSSSKINFPSNNSWRFFNIVSNDFGIAIFESSFQLWEVIQLIFDHFISIFDDWYVNQDFNQIDSLTCFQGVLGEFSTQQVVDDGRFSCAPWPQEKHQGFRKDLRICVLHRYYNISGLLLFFFFWMNVFKSVPPKFRFETSLYLKMVSNERTAFSMSFFSSLRMVATALVRVFLSLISSSRRRILLMWSLGRCTSGASSIDF